MYISSTSLGTDCTTWRQKRNHDISRYAHDRLLNFRRTFHRPTSTATSVDRINLLYRALLLLLSDVTAILWPVSKKATAHALTLWSEIMPW